MLVVDDHQDSANAIVRLLKTEGYEAEAAYGYAQTLDLLKRQAGRGFDVIVTDVRLRDGDGVAMLGEMAGRVPRAIALSGCDEEEEIGRAREAGFEDYLVKPFPVMDLLRAIGGRG